MNAEKVNPKWNNQNGQILKKIPLPLSQQLNQTPNKEI